MKTKAFLSLLFLLFSLLSLRAEGDQIAEYAVSEIPEALKKNADVVLRLSEERFFIENPGKGRFEVKKVITILNAKGKGHADAYVHYDDKLVMGRLISGEVYDAYGNRVSKLSKKDIQDASTGSSGTFVGDNRVQYAELKHHSYPFTVVYTYEQNYNGLFSLPSFAPLMGEKMSIQQASFELVCPAGYEPRYRLLNMPTETKSFVDGNGNKHLRWELMNIPPLKIEPYAPPFSEQEPHVQIAPDQFEIEGYKGQMTDWQAFGKFMYELNTQRDAVPPALQSHILWLTADAQSEHEKIAILYKYLQENTRYVSIQLGIGGFQTFPAGYVYENGYGDCKALSNYMKSMLKQLNINSYLTVIYRGSNPPPIDPGFAINRFNHMILCVPLEADTVWLECTNKHSLPGYLDKSTANRYALLATPEGGKLVRTPSRAPEQNARLRTATIHLQADGHAKINSTQLYSGYLQDHLEDVIGSYAAREKEEYLRETIVPGSYDLGQFALYRDSLATEPSCITQYELSVKNCASASGNRLFLSPNILSWEMDIPEKMSERKQALRFTKPYFIKDSLHFELPKGYVIESLPTFPVVIESPFGSYRAHIEVLGEGQFIYTREVLLREVDQPASAYEAFRDFFRDISKADKLQLVLTNRS